MKKFTLFLVLCLPIITSLSCNKSDEEPESSVAGVYMGQTEGMYRFQMYDQLKDSLTRIDWDTTYADYVKVEINPGTKRIKFTMIDIKSGIVGWEDNVSEYDYTHTTSYLTEYSSHNRQHFDFKQGDSLCVNMDSYSGGGNGNFSQKMLRFKGKKVQ